MPSREISIEFRKENPFTTEGISDSFLILPVSSFSSEEKNPAEVLPYSEWLSKADPHLPETLAEEKFTGGKDKSILIKPSGEIRNRFRRIRLNGCGKPGSLNAFSMQKSYTKAFDLCRSLKGIQTIAVMLPASDYLDQNDTDYSSLSFYEKSPLNLRSWIYSVIDAWYLSSYTSAEGMTLRELKKERKDNDRDEPSEEDTYPEKLIFFTEDPSADPQLIQDAVTVGQSMARARSWSKDLVNMPPNLKSTVTLTKAALALKQIPGFSVTITDDPEEIRRTMPAFYAVSRGSLVSDPPKFIKINYKPEGEIKKKIALIGKSVIFDTGGYQIKPSESMITMKADMTGGAQVIAAMKAFSEIGIKNLELNAYMAVTPNKIDSDAFLPDSIIDTACGKKIEIRSTDAEGRLTLIDAVWKALQDKPDEILTIATLTGAAKRCMGMTISLMSNNIRLAEKIRKECQFTGDPVSLVEITEEDYEDIKSKLDGADLMNLSQSKTRGSQTAGAFVMSATPAELPHYHLDIAGCDMTNDDKSTGYAQKTLIHWIVTESRKF